MIAFLARWFSRFLRRPARGIHRATSFAPPRTVSRLFSNCSTLPFLLPVPVVK